MSDLNQELWLLFQVDSVRVAIPALEAARIIRAPERVTRLPAAPADVVGAFSDDGRAAVAYCLRRKFGFAPRDDLRTGELIVGWLDERAAGLWVDRVLDVLDASHFTRVPLPRILNSPAFHAGLIYENGVVLASGFEALCRMKISGTSLAEPAPAEATVTRTVPHTAAPPVSTTPVEAPRHVGATPIPTLPPVRHTFTPAQPSVPSPMRIAATFDPHPTTETPLDPGRVVRRPVAAERTDAPTERRAFESTEPTVEPSSNSASNAAWSQKTPDEEWSDTTPVEEWTGTTPDEEWSGAKPDEEWSSRPFDDGYGGTRSSRRTGLVVAGSAAGLVLLLFAGWLALGNRPDPAPGTTVRPDLIATAPSGTSVPVPQQSFGLPANTVSLTRTLSDLPSAVTTAPPPVEPSIAVAPIRPPADVPATSNPAVRVVTANPAASSPPMRSAPTREPAPAPVKSPARTAAPTAAEKPAPTPAPTPAAVRSRTAATSAPRSVPASGEYVVRKGDTLWGVAARKLGNPFRCFELARWNGITDPDVIEPGQRIRLSPPGAP